MNDIWKVMGRRDKKNPEMKEEIDAQNEIKDSESTVAESQETAENLTEQPQTEETAEPDFEAKFNEMNDKFLRLYSEFENFRRRTAKERLDLLTNSRGEALKNLIPIVDDFERATANNVIVDDIDAIREGFTLIHNKFVNLLSNEGLKPMETAVGDDFDTDKHEAVTQIPAPEPKLKGKVVDVIEKGYVINDKVIRYAKVVTGS
jgi:molecular chaperone GrpE